MNKKILALSVAQCCYWFATLVGISLSAIVGMELSTHSELATLPFALSSLAALASTYALSQFMQRTSRRTGLRLGTVFGIVAAILSCIALQLQSFWLFCFASFIMGTYQASSAYYRLAAIDVAAPEHKSSAISWVLAGSLLAAIAGPLLAAFANTWTIGAAYTGPYALLGLFALLGYSILGFLRPASVPSANTSRSERESPNTSLKGISPQYWTGAVNTGIAQFLMMLMMVIAPLAMHANHYPVSTSLSVIGWHIIGMFLPSIFSGQMIDRFGEQKIIFMGYGIYALSAVVALVGQEEAHYFVSLFLLGAAWNFVYIAGTAHYNKAISSENKGKAQGIAELVIALAGTVAVFSGGIMVSLSNWSQINKYMLVLLILAFLCNIWFARSKQSTQPQ